MKGKFSLILFLFFSLNAKSQNDPNNYTIVDHGQLGRKGDSVFFIGKPFTGKAIKRKRSDEYKDPIVGEEWYTNGVADGNWKEWYISGEKKFEGAFKNGKNDGVWIEWGKNGTVKRKLTFKNGLLIENKD